MVRLAREIRDLCETVFHVEQPDHDAHDEFDRTKVNDRLRRYLAVRPRSSEGPLSTHSRRTREPAKHLS
jgi:hypothetical protein